MDRPKADRALRYLLEELQAGRKIRDDLIRDYHDSLEVPPPRPRRMEPKPEERRHEDPESEERCRQESVARDMIAACQVHNEDRRSRRGSHAAGDHLHHAGPAAGFRVDAQEALQDHAGEGGAAEGGDGRGRRIGGKEQSRVEMKSAQAVDLARLPSL
jgi:hypothetical protein